MKNPAYDRIASVLRSIDNSFCIASWSHPHAGAIEVWSLPNGREVMIRQFRVGPDRLGGIEVYYNTPTLDLDRIDLEIRALVRSEEPTSEHEEPECPNCHSNNIVTRGLPGSDDYVTECTTCWHRYNEDGVDITFTY